MAYSFNGPKMTAWPNLDKSGQGQSSANGWHWGAGMFEALMALLTPSGSNRDEGDPGALHIGYVLSVGAVMAIGFAIFALWPL